MKLALLAMLVPTLARADVIARVGATPSGPLAGGELVVRRGALEVGTRIDVGLERDRRFDRGELVARYRITPEQRCLFGVAGVRLDRDRASAFAGARFGGRALSLELAVSARIAGDAMFVQHAGFAPGWFARGELRHSRLVLSGELGTSGLATRDPDGTLRGDTRALLTIGLEIWR